MVRQRAQWIGEAKGKKKTKRELLRLRYIFLLYGLLCVGLPTSSHQPSMAEAQLHRVISYWREDTYEEPHSSSNAIIKLCTVSMSSCTDALLICHFHNSSPRRCTKANKSGVPSTQNSRLLSLPPPHRGAERRRTSTQSRYSFPFTHVTCRTMVRHRTTTLPSTATRRRTKGNKGDITTACHASALSQSALCVMSCLDVKTETRFDGR